MKGLSQFKIGQSLKNETSKVDPVVRKTIEDPKQSSVLTMNQMEGAGCSKKQQ